MVDLDALSAAVNVASAIVLIGLGLVVGLRPPRRRVTLAFAAVSIGLGAWNVSGNLLFRYAFDDVGYVLLFLAWGGAAAAAAAGLFALPGAATRPAEGEPPWIRWVPLLAPAAALGATLSDFSDVAASVAAFEQLGIPGRYFPLVLGAALAYTLMFGGFLYALILFALRHGDSPGPANARRRRDLVMLAVPLALYPAVWSGTNAWANLALGYVNLLSLTVLAGLVVVGVLWLHATSRVDPPEARGTRNLAWACLGLPLAGAVAAQQLGASLAIVGFHLGLVRIAMVSLLAYAILKHQLLGIDVKVRWTVKQSTIAAAFIGVFFVVSETASTFFASEGGLGPYMGIAAAGGLVFALAPLQRAAERLALAAVPGAQGAPAPGKSDSPRARYRRLAELAWRDGTLTAKERGMLDEARRQLGLGREEAGAIEGEVAEGTLGRRAESSREVA